MNNFLIEQLNIIILTIINLLVFLIGFILFEINLNIYLMLMNIIVFILFCYLVIKYFGYKQKLSLNEKNQALTNQNKQLKKQIIEHNKMIQEYFLIWLHQMKTPITAAKLLIEGRKLDPFKIKQELFYIEEYANSALSYLKLIDHNNDLDLDTVNIDDLITETLKKYAVVFINNHITLNYEKINTQIISDSKLLAIALEQLISNAAKYTKNGIIKIKMEDDQLLIIDNGCGIKASDLPKIFNCGYSGFNGRLNSKSSGIGLYLTKSICQRLNIKVIIESEFQKGCTAKLIFPNDTILHNCKK